VLLDGEPLVHGSPLTLAVEPNDLCVRRTNVTGELTAVTAGERAVLRIFGVDEFGNAVLPSTDVGFGISLRGKSSRRPVEMTCGSYEWAATGARVDAEGPTLIGGGEVDRPRATLHGYWVSAGVFELMYTCSGADSYLLHLWYRDAAGIVHELPGSPQNLLVSAADADARGSSIFEGETPLRHKTLVAGTTMSAYLQVGDRFSNPTQPKEGELIVQLQGPRGRRRLLPTALSMAPQEEALDSTVHANELDSPRVSDGVRSAAGTPRGSLTSPRGLRPKSPSPLTQSGTHGLFEVREQLDLSGSYTLSATVLGEHVGGSPIELQITPAPLDALHSVLIPPPDAAIVHQPSTFVVQPRDS